jgi:Tol biopolymer transport system component
MFARSSGIAAFIFVAATVTGAATAGHTSARQGQAGYTGTIAFVRDGKGDHNALWVIHADGSGLRRIVRPRVGVSGYEWSPNGRLIAYIDARGSLWLVRPDGTGLRRLLPGSTLASMGLSWSPDGKKIAITSPGPFAKGKTPDNCVVYVVPIHGSQQLKLGDTSTSCWGDPAWSPRGDEIAYGAGADSDGIWVIHADGSGNRQVSGNGWNFPGPRWSSDGTQLVFNVSVGDMGPAGYRYFAVVNSDGTHYHVVTNKAYNEYGEVWSPRGRRILYGHANGGIYVIGSNRQNNHRVTTDSAGQSEAAKLAWSPDGRSIAYSASTGGLYEVGVDGRSKVQLLPPGHGGYAPSWVARRS